MDFAINDFSLLLLIAAVVAIVAQRCKLPYSIGLVVAGIALAFVKPMNIPFTKDVIFNGFLPPLIFEAALFIVWKHLKRDLPIILVFVTAGLLLSAAVTAIGMHYLADWSWASAGVFGILIAATDPVSVIATFKEAGVHGRLRLLVEAESLMNDGTAAVGFIIAVALATGAQTLDAGHIATTLFTTVTGGVLCGALVSGGILLLAGKAEDHLVEITLTTIIAYSSFILAEHYHFSGVLSCMTAGLITGNYGFSRSLTQRGREAVTNFWEYAAFVANSLIFILIGISEAKQTFAPMLAAGGIAIALVTLGRAVAIYPFSALFARSRLKVDMAQQHVLFWGGLRGALALGLALGLPDDMPNRENIVTITFMVVAFSIFVQGLTMTPLLKKLGQLPKEGSIRDVFHDS